MRKYASPYIADWFAISLRWLAIFGLSVSLQGEGGWLELVPLFILALWNLSLSVMAGLNTRFNYHRQISIGVDLLFSSLLFAFSGGIAGNVMWVAILPILTGAVYFEIKGGLIAGAIMGVVALAYIYFTVPVQALIFGVVFFLFSIGLGGLFGFLSFKLVGSLRRVREVDAKKQRRREAKRISVENKRLAAVSEMITTLNSTLNYNRVLEQALYLSVRAMHPEADETFTDQLVGAVLLFVDNELIVKSARRFANPDLKRVFPGTEGVLGTAIEGGEAVLTQDVVNDPELRSVIALRACTSAYCIPLRTGYSVYGILLFSHPDVDYFSAERREMLDLIGRQSVIAIQNASLYQDLIEEKERMIEVQEEARKKLARDLHDGPTQSVSAIAMRLNLIRMMLTKAPDKVENELIRTEDLARRTTKEIRHMLFTLRPLVLESQGLRAALESMAEKMLETYDQKVQVEVEESLLEQLEIGKQGVIFFIAEEAVNNARKHAQAPIIKVRLRTLQEGISVLEIMDNGVGFDVKAVNENYENRGSLGMINLEERSELLNGLLQIDSERGRGTNVQVFIPLTEEAADRLHRSK